MTMGFATAGVIGLGTMGSGVAEVLARTGITVVGVEKDAAGADRARLGWGGSTARAVARRQVRCGRALRPARSDPCGDRAGFIVNALLFPYLNDAVAMLEAHYATADDIDLAMKEGCRLPIGPFAPAPLLEHLVTAGYLGRKTGRGFRNYSA